MKKFLIIGLLLSVFTGVFADKLYKGKAKLLESKFSFNYKDPKIGKVTLENLEYDLKFYTNSALLEVEVETFSGDGGWSKLKRDEIDDFFNLLAEKIRNEVNKPELPVNVIVEIEKKVGEDTIVLNKLY